MAHREPGLVEPACNFIARDNYWKKCVEKEGDAAKRWSDKWGFLKTPLEELIGDEKKDAKPKIELPEHMRIRPVTPVEKYIKVRAVEAPSQSLPPDPKWDMIPFVILLGASIPSSASNHAGIHWLEISCPRAGARDRSSDPELQRSPRQEPELTT